MATCAGEVLGEFSMTCTYASKPISQCFPYGCPQTQQRTPTATYQTELADPGGGPTARRGRGTWEVAVVRPTPCCFLLSVGRFSPSACFSCLSSRRFVVLFVRPFVRRLCHFYFATQGTQCPSVRVCARALSWPVLHPSWWDWPLGRCLVQSQTGARRE